jgi:hypothetical protein
LRSFEDYVVAALPSEADLTRLAQLYPDIRVELHATVGRKLSDEFQDGKTYRYGVINLGGNDLAHVLAQFESCREHLGIVLLPIGAPQDASRMEAVPQTEQLGA